MADIYALYIKTIKENSVAVKYPEIALEWNYELNKGLSPAMFNYGSNKTVWWTCQKCKTDYDMEISKRTSGKMNCPYCAGKRIRIGLNDIATTHPDLVKDWDYEENDLLPQEISRGSDKRISWNCHKCGYKWKATLSSRVAGSGCPLCAGKVVVEGVNDLATLNPEAVKFWNYQKTITDPIIIQKTQIRAFGGIVMSAEMNGKLQ